MIVDYSLSDYIDLIYKRRKYFFIIVVLSLFVAFLLSLVLPPVYQAKLTMYTPSTSDTMRFMGRGGAGTTLRPLLPTLNELFSGAVLGLLKSEVMRDVLSTKVEERKKEAFDYTINFSPDNGLFDVIVSDRNPEIAAKIANFIPEAANEVVVEVSETALKNNMEYIEKQLDIAKLELEEARDNLRQFREENIHVILGQQSSMIISRNVEYRVEYDRLGVDLDRIQASVDALEREMEKEAQLFVEEEAVTLDPTIQQVRSSLTGKEMRMANLKTQFTEFHPAVVALQKEIEDTKELLRREVERLFISESKPYNSFYESLRRNVVQDFVELSITNARRDAISRLIDESNQILYSLPAIENELANLVFEEKVDERVVEGLVANLTELKLQIGRQFQSFIVLERAKVPSSPSFPIIGFNVLVAIIFGVAGGIFYCVLLEYFERSKIARYADAGTD